MQKEYTALLYYTAIIGTMEEEMEESCNWVTKESFSLLKTV